MMILGVILPCYTRSEDQLADVFTKAARQKTMESIHIRSHGSSKLDLFHMVKLEGSVEMRE
ncbi:hypothetical protein Bca4012_103202 [Brassica carinata]